MHYPLRLTVDRSTIQANWRWLADHSGVAAGAAIKADGYGLGARQATDALLQAGCRDFFVSTWAEAQALGAV
ncbi:MAG: alanine racemase, partial [Sphingomicrobium sp.]